MLGILVFPKLNQIPNEECHGGIQNVQRKKIRQQAYNKIKRTGDPNDYLQYKKQCAVVKRVTKNAKRTYWRDYCSTITNDYSIPKIWRTIKRMNNTNQSFTVPVIKNQAGEHLTDNENKADALAEHFAAVSSDGNYNETFLEHREKFESDNRKVLSPTQNTQDVYNEKFTLEELVA
ncbi:hypothetical protein BOW14_12795, partial [Solemya velum gill symbiont]|uniref:hypothetical protein n=1 Tax=Solemya velum gill symbiont TaxID=2340 RepID=UPI0009CF870F